LAGRGDSGTFNTLKVEVLNVESSPYCGRTRMDETGCVAVIRSQVNHRSPCFLKTFNESTFNSFNVQKRKGRANPASPLHCGYRVT
jgi:hypothetical protein